jgi:hypothetical protein
MTEISKEEKLVAVRGFVPESLRNTFKAVCAEEGKTMSEVFSEFVEGYVAERRGKPNQKKPK